MSDTQPEAKEQANDTTPPNGTNMRPASDGKPVSETGSTTASAQTGTTAPNADTELANVQAKAAEYLDGWQRARADFANYKKRAEKEREEVYQIAAADMLRKILPVIDDFDRAISNLPAGKEEDDVIKGFNLIYRKLLNLLDTAGIKILNPVGEVFNPELHEAIGTDETSNVESGHVSAVLQKGYMHGDKVLRPAMVRVAS